MTVNELGLVNLIQNATLVSSFISVEIIMIPELDKASWSFISINTAHMGISCCKNL